MGSARLNITVSYDADGVPADRPVSDSVDTLSGAKLEGRGDQSSARTMREVPNGAGATTKRERVSEPPKDAKITNASVRMALTCDDGTSHTLDDTGNHSVSGKLDGECIEITATDRTRNGEIVETVTRTQRWCCGQDKVSALPSGERAALWAELDALKARLASARPEAPGRLPPSGGEDRPAGLRARPRTWAAPAGGEMKIGSVMAKSPAEAAGLKRKDIILDIGGKTPESADALSEIVGALTPAEPVELTLARGKRERTLKIVPGLLLLKDLDVMGDPVEGRECDGECRCTKENPDRFCMRLWLYAGEGPNGGVLFEHHCVSVQNDGEGRLLSSECGVGEYV